MVLCVRMCDWHAFASRSGLTERVMELLTAWCSASPGNLLYSYLLFS